MNGEYLLALNRANDKTLRDFTNRWFKGDNTDPVESFRHRCEGDFVRILRQLLSKVGLDRLLGSEIPSGCSSGRFLRVVTCMERDLGPLCDANPSWVDTQRLTSAARRVAFVFAKEALDARRSSKVRAKKAVLVDMLRDLRCLTGISSNPEEYLSLEAIAVDQKQARLEAELRQGNDSFHQGLA